LAYAKYEIIETIPVTHQAFYPVHVEACVKGTGSGDADFLKTILSAFSVHAQLVFKFLMDAALKTN
jgi:hypothetical protein